MQHSTTQEYLLSFSKVIRTKMERLSEPQSTVGVLTAKVAIMVLFPITATKLRPNTALNPTALTGVGLATR